MLFILGQLLLLRKDFRPVQFLQIAVNVIFSLFIDVSMNLLSWLEPDTLPVRFLTLIVGCAVLGFGISIEVAPNVIVVPGEGIVKAIAITTRQRFGTTKVIFDVTLVTAAALLSFFFFHQLKGLGIGTLISALIVGRFVNLYNRNLPLISSISALAE